MFVAYSVPMLLERHSSTALKVGSNSLEAPVSNGPQLEQGRHKMGMHYLDGEGPGAGRALQSICALLSTSFCWDPLLQLRQRAVHIAAVRKPLCPELLSTAMLV